MMMGKITVDLAAPSREGYENKPLGHADFE